MIIKTAARQNWPDGAGRTLHHLVRAVRRAEPDHRHGGVGVGQPEVTGIATPADVRLLSLVVRAEADRGGLPPGRAEAALRDEPNYSSPFVDIPF